jgi:transposase
LYNTENDPLAKSKLPEFTSFANGISEDIQAIKAALEYEWSQGQVEGQVNRLKLLKRQMYGRGKLDLLRARVLYAR